MNSPDIEITLNIYSGRRNPTWNMPPSHALYKRIGDLFQVKATNVREIGLGYYGFTLKRGSNTVHIMYDIDAEKSLLEIMCKNIREMISTEMENYIHNCIADNMKTTKINTPDIEITLNIYSGRRNPTWNMPPSHALYNKMREWFGVKETNVCDIGLGYYGFKLQFGKDTVHIIYDSDKEKALLQIMCKNKREMISTEVEKYIYKCIEDNMSTGATKSEAFKPGPDIDQPPLKTDVQY